MKKSLLLAATIVCNTWASAQVIYETNFSTDTVGRNLSGQNGWSNSSNSGYPGSGDCAGLGCLRAQVQTDTLVSPIWGYFAGRTLRAVRFEPNQDAVGHFFRGRGNALPDNAAFEAYPAGTKIYASFLAQFSNAPVSTTNGQFLRFNGDTYSVGMRLYVQKSATNKLRFGIEKNGGSTNSRFTANYDYDLNRTYLFVLKYEVVAGTDNDIISLYLNPTAGSEPTTPLLTVPAGTDYNIDRIMFYLNQANAPTGKFSGLRITKTWNDLGISGNATNRIGELDEALFSVRPTIAQQHLTLTWIGNTPPPSVSRVQVMDMSGRVVLADTWNQESLHKMLTISHLAKGLYLLQVVSDQKICIKKFIKE